MLDRMILAAAAVVLLTAPGVGQDTAQECQSLDQEGRAAVLRAAPTCDKSMALFSDCAYGASGDLMLGQVVTEKCEGDFLAKLGKAERRIYDGKIKACGRKYANEDGTMYRAMEAGCRADTAQQYSRRFRKAGTRK